ncbi:MAG TPA: glycosyltransferase [Candidatus Polarisedimenticolia bacterium]|nr:glycosyltransferase [Candidatus Polarisedimenticolia bacterium]
MRVLHVGKYYPPYDGGIEAHLQTLASGLAERCEVTALVFNTSPRTVEETVEGVRVVRAGSLGRLFSTELSPAFFRLFRRLRHADVIHLHTPNPLGELACLAAPKGARLVITYHSDVVRQRLLGRLNRFVLHRLIRRADRVITFTRRYMETSPVLSRHEDKCVFIPHGIDGEEMAGTPAVSAMAARLRAEHGPRIVLFVGRLVYYKGVDVLLRAMTGVPGARLLIAGDGPMRPDLERLTAELGLGGRVVFLGKVSHQEKVACYRAGDVFVLPATHRSEAFGVVQVEALACGLPVVCTNIDSGVPFVNRHGETGLVVEPNDPEGLAAAIRTILEDASLRGRFGEAAVRRASERFSRQAMIRDCMALYTALTGVPEAGRSAAARRPAAWRG